MGTLLFAITLGLGNVLLAHPLGLQVLKWCGIAMLCWMAWRIAVTRPSGGGTVAPAGFLGMAAFQWINPKGWLVAIAAIATFLNQGAGGALAQAVIFALLFMLVATPSCLPWLMFGAAIQRFLRTPRAHRAFNGVMAALLVASTIPLAWTRV
jgi:threonine/homoserine/homoserine lactone efflux protein